MKKDGLEFGILTSQGSGVVSIQGLVLAFVGQVFSIEDAQKTTRGTIVNISRDDTMNLVISGLQLQPEARVYEGGIVVCVDCKVTLFSRGLDTFHGTYHYTNSGTFFAAGRGYTRYT